MELTQELADELADKALALRVAVGAFRHDFFPVLTPEQREGLLNLSIALGDQVDHLTVVAVQLTLAGVREAIDDLGKVTTLVNRAVAHMSDLRKILTIATSLVDLGAAIVARDPGAAVAALQKTAASAQA
jgi:hypothetical protein